MDAKLLFYTLLVCLEVTKGNDQKNREFKEIVENRQKRDGYGCHCGYNGCDGKDEKLLYFGAGVILGLLLSYAINNPGGRSLSNQYSHTVYNHSVISNLPQLPTNELETFVSDLFQIYYGRDKMSNCAHRWICEVTKNAVKEGNLENVVPIIFNALSSWIPIDIIQNRTQDFTNYGALQWLNCRILSPNCKEAFVRQ